MVSFLHGRRRRILTYILVIMVSFAGYDLLTAEGSVLVKLANQQSTYQNTVLDLKTLPNFIFLIFFLICILFLITLFRYYKLKGGMRRSAQSLSKLHNLLNAFPEKLFIIAENRKIVYTNTTDQTRPGRALGTYFWELFPMEHQQSVSAAYQQTVKRDTQDSYSFKLENGKQLTTNRITFLPYSDGELLMLWETANETPVLTDNASAQQPNVQNTLDKISLLARISHEIRTPMTGIMGMTELVLSSDLKEEQRENLHIVKSSAENLLNIMKEILELSKLESNSIALDPSKFRLCDLIDDAVKIVGVHAEKKKLNLSYQISPRLPDILIGDASRLRQVLTNLLKNAVRSTDRGGINIRIEPDGKIFDDQMRILFSVTDTGGGTSEDRKSVLFKSFLETDYSKYANSGASSLGMALVKKLVDLMEGEIWVESPSPFIRKDWDTPGTTVYFTVTLKTAGTGTHIAREETTIIRATGMKVLILSDSESNGHRLQKLIYKWEMSPRVCYSQEQAEKTLDDALERNRPFQLMIIDCECFAEKYLDFVRNIRKNAHEEPDVIVITDDQVDIFYEDHHKYGIGSYLKNPVKPSEIFDAIVSLKSKIPDDRETRKVQSYSGTVHSDETAPLNILLAEDNAINQKLAARMLRRLGHRVSIANHGAEAVSKWEKDAFDMILMDLHMPEMDGFEATSHIRKREKSSGQHIPIIALTAQAMTGDRERCLAGGMDGYAAKPLRLETLLPEIEKLVLKNPTMVS